MAQRRWTSVAHLSPPAFDLRSQSRSARLASFALVPVDMTSALLRRKATPRSGRVDGRLFHSGRLEVPLSRFHGRASRAWQAAGVIRSLIVFHMANRSIGSP